MIKKRHKVKIIYIAGWGRSGSTLLSNMLGQIPAFFSAGEIRLFWKMGLMENGYCGCGDLVKDCLIWTEVYKLAYGHTNKMDIDTVSEMCYQETRYLNSVRIFSSLVFQRLSSRLKQLTMILERLYLSLGQISDDAVIVDSSKSPLYAAVLKLIAPLDVYIVHLVREPRAVAFSSSKPKGKLKVSPPFLTAFMWGVSNIMSEVLGLLEPKKYFFLRYEDFVEKPKESMRDLLEFISASCVHLPFFNDNELIFSRTHSVSGNPNRFDLGKITIKQDLRWKESMTPFDKVLVGIITWPFLLKYRYLKILNRN